MRLKCTHDSTTLNHSSRLTPLAYLRMCGVVDDGLMSHEGVSHPKVLEPKVFQRDKGIFGTKVFFNTFATPPPIRSEETQHK